MERHRQLYIRLLNGILYEVMERLRASAHHDSSGDIKAGIRDVFKDLMTHSTYFLKRATFRRS